MFLCIFAVFTFFGLYDKRTGVCVCVCVCVCVGYAHMCSINTCGMKLDNAVGNSVSDLAVNCCDSKN